jgi:hypothetical protein
MKNPIGGINESRSLHGTEQQTVALDVWNGIWKRKRETVKAIHQDNINGGRGGHVRNRA